MTATRLCRPVDCPQVFRRAIWAEKSDPARPGAASLLSAAAPAMERS